MYHAHLRGTHREAGFRWGSLLLKHKNILTGHIPFDITAERMEYAMACEPVYRRYYPEILEEIWGLSEGQQCDGQILKTVLFSMYAIPPFSCCSCFAVSDGENALLGRNSDFLTELEKLNMNVIYRLSDGAYAFTGNTTAFVEMEDGVNEHGLAAGLTTVAPFVRRPGFNAGLLLRYLLEKCRSVPEAIAALNSIPIASPLTLTMADASGSIAVAECLPGRVEIAHTMSGTPQNKKPSFVCATNKFHLPPMTPFNLPDIDDWNAEERYQTMFRALRERKASADSSRTENSTDQNLDFAQNLLSGQNGFICQYDRATGKDTVWSVIYDLKTPRIFRAEGNPSRRTHREDNRFFK